MMLAQLNHSKPRTLRIGAADYTVLWHEDEQWVKANDCDGTHCMGKARIEMAWLDDYTPAYVAMVLLHEITHAILVWYGPNTQDALPNERVAECIAKGMAQVLRDNPALVTWLQTALMTKELQ